MDTIVIVDAFSAGNLLAPEFNGRGFQCVHVQTTREIWPIVLPTFRPDDFKARLVYDGDLDKLVKELSPYRVVGVLPGTETGVELADQISEQIPGVPSNGTALSEARRNKYLMVEAVRDAGLRAALQIRTDSLSTALSWTRANGLSKVVVKPLKSAGTDSVAICTNEAEIEAAFSAILGKVNKIGIPNTEVLVQEFLKGTEYFLNTVSVGGKAHFTEIWKYKKRSINGHDCVYDCNELLPLDPVLAGYVEKVLAALGIVHGPAHTEVMLTDDGPVLVESGARLDGLSVPSVNLACVGYGPLDLTADAYVNLDEYRRKTQTPYSLAKHALTVYLTSYREGTVVDLAGTEKIKALPSFFQMRLRVKEGSPVKKTIDYFTAPGFFTLVHEDKSQLLADYDWVRGAEQRGEILTVEGAPN